jgi:HEPN domain-containing protein
MKPPEQVKREFVRQWVQKAEADWRVSRYLLGDSDFHGEGIVFHAQQAVEKYLKAVLIWHQVEFSKTHDIARLLVLVASCDPALAESLRDVVELTPYGAEYRYPGEYPPVTPSDAREAMEMADRVRAQVRPRLPGDTLD